MVLNIGSFALDFTGSLGRQLGDRGVDTFLPLTAYRHRSSFHQQQPRDRPSYSARAARHQTNLLTEWFHGFQLRPSGADNVG